MLQFLYDNDFIALNGYGEQSNIIMVIHVLPYSISNLV